MSEIYYFKQINSFETQIVKLDNNSRMVQQIGMLVNEYLINKSERVIFQFQKLYLEILESIDKNDNLSDQNKSWIIKKLVSTKENLLLLKKNKINNVQKDRDIISQLLFDQQILLGKVWEIRSYLKKKLDKKIAWASTAIILISIITLYSIGILAIGLKSKITTPLTTILNGIKSIPDSGKDIQIVSDPNSEFSQIANSLNQLRKSIELSNSELLRSMELRANFLSEMSHEIRNPINGILGHLELAVEDKTLDEKTKEHIEIAFQSSLDIKDLVNRILDFSKIQNNSIIMENKSFDLDMLIQDVVNLQNVNAQAKHMNIILSSNIQGKHILIGDSLRLKQVIGNILGNGIKFSEGKDIILTLNCSPVSKDKASILISIKDQGKGIEKEKQEDIFKKFIQENSSIEGNYGGTGLGLTISKNIIEQIGGEIWLESKVGKGTTFFISFQLPYGEIKNSEDKIQKFNFQNQKVLVVDDQSMNQKLLKSILESVKIDVTLASNGVEAIEAVKEFPRFDLIFMDVQMPKLNGLEASERILEMNPDLNIVICTATTFEKDLKKFKSYGVQKIILKPIQKKSVLSILDSYFENKKVS